MNEWIKFLFFLLRGWELIKMHCGGFSARLSRNVELLLLTGHSQLASRRSITLNALGFIYKCGASVIPPRLYGYAPWGRRNAHTHTEKLATIFFHS